MHLYVGAAEAGAEASSPGAAAAASELSIVDLDTNEVGAKAELVTRREASRRDFNMILREEKEGIG